MPENRKNNGKENRLIRSTILKQSGKFLASGVLITILLHRVGLNEIFHSIQNIRIEYLLIAVCVFSISHLIGSFQWWLLLGAQGIPIPWKKTYGFYLVGLFFNNFLLGTLGGDFFRIFDMKRYSKNGTSAISTVFLDRVMGLLVLSGLSIIWFPFLIIRGQQKEILIPMIILLITWIVILLLLFNKSFVQPFAWLMKKTLPAQITNKSREFYQKIRDFSQMKEMIRYVICISLLVQSTRILTHYFVGRALGVRVSPIFFFIFIPMIAIIASLPISLGGIGFREQSAVILFSMIGIGAVDASLMEFLAYLVAIGSSLPGGLIFILRTKVTDSDHKITNTKFDLGEIS